MHTDDQLIEQILAGSREQYAPIVERHEAVLFAYIRSRVGPGADAEDLTQDTFVEAYLSLDRYEPGSSFPAWLRSIGRNLVRNHYRSQSRRKEATLIEACVSREASEPPPAPPTDALHRCIEKLDEAARGIVRAFYRDAKSLKAIGADVQRSVSSVGVILHRARHRLRACLERAGVEPPS